MSQVQDLVAVDEHRIRSLSEASYPEGVVSVYATVDFTDPPAVLPAVRNELRAAVQQAISTAPESRHRALTRAGARIDEQVHRCLGEPPHHAAVAGFVDLANEDASLWLTLEVPSITHAWHAEHPVLTPLLRATLEAEPAGVVVATGEEAQVWEWSAGHFEQVDSFEMSVDTGAWRRKQGPGPSGADRPGVSRSSQVDLFDRKMNLERERFLTDGVVPALAELASQEGWTRLVVWGPGPLRQAAADLTSRVRVIDGGDTTLVHSPKADLKHRVEDAIAGDRTRRELDFATLLTDGSETRVARGIAAVRQAAEAGNVDSAAVTLAAADGPREQLLAIEHVVRLVLGQGGTVLPVAGDAAALLDSHEGIAARLRHA